MSTTENNPAAAAAPIGSPDDMRFVVYGKPFQSITFGELAAMQRDEGSLWARGEDSGCEGSYCEIARWNHARERWEKFAFLKFHGGEHPTQPDLGCDEAADFVAAEINRIGYGNNRAPIVSRMPSWEGAPQS